MKSLLILLCFASTALADKTIVIDASNSSSGTYFYKIVVTANGTTAVPIPNVVRPNSTGGPIVIPTDPTIPAGITSKVAALTKATLADGGTATTAKGLSVLFGMVAKSYSEGKLGDLGTVAGKKEAVVKATAAIHMARRAVIREGRETRAWKNWNAGVDKIMDDNMSPKTLLAISAGLEAGTVESMVQGSGGKPEAARGRFKNIDIEKLLKIISIILKIFGIGIPF